MCEIVKGNKMQSMQFIKKARNTLLFVSLCMIGGTTYAVQKLGLAEGLPLWSAGMRFLLAGSIMAGYSFFKKTWKPDSATISAGAQYGILYFAIPFGIIYWVGQYLPSGLLSVLSASVSIFSIIFNYTFFKVKTTKTQMYGIFLSLGGIIIIFLQSILLSYESNMMLYLLACTVAYIGAAYATASLKHKVTNINQLYFNIIALLTGGGILCVFSLIVEHGNRVFVGVSLIALIYLAIAGSMLSTRITTFLMSQWDIAKVTSYRYISPVISLLVGFVFWREVLSFHEIVGALFIISGTIVINRN